MLQMPHSFLFSFTSFIDNQSTDHMSDAMWAWAAAIECSAVLQSRNHLPRMTRRPCCCKKSISMTDSLVFKGHAIRGGSIKHVNTGLSQCCHVVSRK
jgi:hypothetical protein